MNFACCSNNIFKKCKQSIFVCKKGDALMSGSTKGGMKGDVRGRKPKPLKKKERKEKKKKKKLARLEKQLAR
jgi:hypothetical protein